MALCFRSSQKILTYWACKQELLGSDAPQGRRKPSSASLLSSLGQAAWPPEAPVSSPVKWGLYSLFLHRIVKGTEICLCTELSTQWAFRSGPVWSFSLPPQLAVRSNTLLSILIWCQQTLHIIYLKRKLVTTTRRNKNINRTVGPRLKQLHRRLSVPQFLCATTARRCHCVKWTYGTRDLTSTVHSKKTERSKRVRKRKLKSQVTHSDFDLKNPKL